MVLKPNKGKPLNNGGGGSPFICGAIWQLVSKGGLHKCDDLQIVEVLNFLEMQRNLLLDKSDCGNDSKFDETSCFIEYNPPCPLSTWKVLQVFIWRELIPLGG